MSISNFVINSKESLYQLSAGSAQALEFTIEFDSDIHPATLTIQYDIDDSGKSYGVTFDNGSTSIQLSADTPDRLNDSVNNSFTLTNGSNCVFGINLTIVENSNKTEDIDINYTNALAAAMLIKNYAENGLMKDVKAMVNKAVKSGINKHIKEMHSKN